MDKDAYYFPHFCNARHDRKIRRVRKELGPEGYGIFFMLLEVLRDQSDFRYPTADLDLLADEFGTSEQKVRTVVTNYELFDMDEKEQFFSPKLQVYLQPYLEKSQRAKLAAEKRWSNHRKQIEESKGNANALQKHSKSNADQNAIRTEETIIDDNKTEEIRKGQPFIMAALLHYLHQEKVDSGYKKKESDLFKWSEDIDKLNRIDGRSWEDIEKVIRWVKESDFWASNIMSGSKLRKQYDTLYGQMKNGNFNDKKASGHNYTGGGEINYEW